MKEPPNISGIKLRNFKRSIIKGTSVSSSPLSRHFFSLGYLITSARGDLDTAIIIVRAHFKQQDRFLIELCHKSGTSFKGITLSNNMSTGFGIRFSCNHHNVTMGVGEKVNRIRELKYNRDALNQEIFLGCSDDDLRYVPRTRYIGVKTIWHTKVICNPKTEVYSLEFKSDGQMAKHEYRIQSLFQ